MAAMENGGFSTEPNLEQLRSAQAAFASERDWCQFHTPRNLVLALVGEVGELAECFQWRGEVQPGLPGWSDSDKQHLGEELSDVLLYLLRLSDVCGVDLPVACAAKMARNAAKYPAHLARGSARKYTEYQQEDRQGHQPRGRGQRAGAGAGAAGLECAGTTDDQHAEAEATGAGGAVPEADGGTGSKRKRAEEA
jgi:dCTP diphosphatase